MNSKIIKYITIGAFLIAVFIGLLFLLNPSSSNSNKYTYTEATSEITISSEGEFSQEECSARNLKEKVIMLESKYCSACKATLPTFKKACEEEGIAPEILDLSVPEQRAKMKSYGIQITYTPTFIFGCKYYVGAKNEQEYKSIIEEFKNEQNI